MRRRRSLWILLGSLVLLALVFAIFGWPGGSRFTISPQTTYVTGPLDKDGYVDYVTALNERLGQGITPENNANVLICQAIGPCPEGSALPDEYYRLLGIEPLAEQGQYLVSWFDYWQTHAKDKGEKIDAERELSESASMLWTAKQEPVLADWLKQIDKPLARVVEATRRPAYFNPLVTGDPSFGLIGALLPTVQRCRGLATALCCRAMLRTAEGKLEEAWQDLLACHRLARLVSRGGTLIEMLVGIAIEHVACKADLVFLEHAKWNAKQLLACWTDLEQLPPMDAVADKIDLGERFMILDATFLTSRHGLALVEGLSRSGGTPSFKDPAWSRLLARSTNWDPALMAANRWTDRMVACLRMTDRDAREQEMKAIDRDLKVLKNGVMSFDSAAKFLMPRGRGEVMGNILVTMVLPAFQKVQSAAERREQVLRNLHVAFALAAYQRDHGKYPAKLEELRPAYLREVPADLFSGKPLIYRLADKGYLLYSVGPNGKDDDGRGYDDQPRGDDLPVRMPAPAK